MMNAEQLSAAARRWHEDYNCGHDDGRPNRYTTSPYRVLVAGARPAGTDEPLAVLLTREFFPGVDIAYLHPLGGNVVTGQLSLHVVPQAIYTEAGWEARDPFGIEARLEPAPFAAAPTEAAMAAVLIQALSKFADTARGREHRAASLQSACDKLGWRTVAALVNAMDAGTRKSSDDVTAVLNAVAADPAACA